MTLQSCAQPLPPEAEASIKSRNPRPKPDLRKPVFIPKNYVFKRGPPGRYAVRILDSPGQPTKNYAIRNIEFYKKSADSVNEEFADSLSYHAAKILKVALRTWTILQNKPKKSHDFRLCSYNVLCQTTLEQTKFLYARQDERFLEWGYRSVKFEKELPALDADVFCLQEVNLLHFKSFFLPLFKKLGFEGRFEQKPKRDDGCAIFFKSSVFKQVAYRRVDLFHSDDSTLNKPNVGQIIRLRHEPSKREICVANTHLVFGKKLGATKFVQMALMLAHLKVVLDKGSKADYVLCGDLNIEPFSDIYAFLIRKELNLDKCVEALMSGQDFFAREKSRPMLRIPAEVGLISDCTLAKKQPKSDANSATKWTHGLDFVSVYNHLRPDKTRDMSTFHSKEALNPDFIFYSIEYVAEERGVLQVKESGLKLLNRLELPNISEANAAFGPWPNKFTPSDHVPLLVDFAFVQ